MAKPRTMRNLAIILSTGFGTFVHALPSASNTLDLRSNANAALETIDTAISSLGGYEALAGLRGVTYQADKDFRIRTVMQNYNLFDVDRYVVNSGAQNVSFSYRDEGFSQRIDRTIFSSEFWLFLRPETAPRSFSMVAQSGEDGFVCFVKGNNIVSRPFEETYGYADSAMTEYLQLQAFKLSPTLLLAIRNNSPTFTNLTFREVEHPAVHDDKLNLTVVFDPVTYLPYLIRSIEDHPILGLIPQDLQLFDYVEVEGLQFPRQQKIVLSEDRIVEETIITAVHVNPQFDRNHFDGLSTNDSATNVSPSPPKQIPGYSHALLDEYWSNTIWEGLYRGNLDNISVTHPAEDLPNAHHLVFLDNAGFAQLILEFEESIIVFESPPHQTDLVIQWVNQKLGKPISHLWVSHHHHDHNMEVAKFVEIGATIIVPEIATSYWDNIPNIKLEIIKEDEPFIHSDGQMQARFLWEPNNPHAADYSYSIVTAACPTADSSMLAYTADTYSNTGVLFQSHVANAWFLQALDDGLSKNATIIPAHGPPCPFSDVYEKLGTTYPDYDSTSFVGGGEICLSGKKV